MRNAIRFILLMVLAAPGMTQAQFPCIEFAANRDNTLYEDEGGALSNGAGSYLFAGRSNQSIGSIRRAVLRFELADTLQPGDTTFVYSVDLFTHVSKLAATPQSLYLYRLRANWGEGSSDAPGEEGAGITAAADDATWLHTFSDTAFWLTPGGDFDTIPSGGLYVTDTGGYAWTSFDKMKQDINDWIREPSTNFGWIVLGNESETGTAVRFDSRQNVLTAFGPTLRVTTAIIDCWCAHQGDMNGDVFLDAVDLNALIQTLFFNGPNPWDPNCIGPRADLDCNEFVDALDLNVMIDLLFFGGALPCNPCDYYGPCQGLP